MPDNVKFKPNVPVFLALTDPTGELDQWNQVTYPTTCGRLLTVSCNTAVKINELDLQPGERFGICKDMESDRGPASWRVWTPQDFDALLSADESRLAKRVLGVDRAANFEDKHWHLYVAEDTQATAAAL